MSENMAGMDWTTAEGMAELTAEELAGAFERVDIKFFGVGHLADTEEISTAFHSIQDAERAVLLGVPYEDVPGSFYDRATASCLTLTVLGHADEPVDSDVVHDAMDRGWRWTIHPDRSGYGNLARWHVSVEMSAADAQQLTANLNASHMNGCA